MNFIMVAVLLNAFQVAEFFFVNYYDRIFLMKTKFCCVRCEQRDVLLCCVFCMLRGEYMVLTVNLILSRVLLLHFGSNHFSLL